MIGGFAIISYSTPDIFNRVSYNGLIQCATAERNGHGTLKWADGAIYTGKFESGVRNGYGRMVYANGDVYEGEFARDKRSESGRGTYVWSKSGEMYVGGFQDRQVHDDEAEVYSPWSDEEVNAKKYWLL